jgi:hypothetical protein
MRYTLLLFAALILSPSASAQLVISGVIDGPLSGGTPKAIELYAAEAISDLSIYGIGSANNGGGSDGEEFTLSGSAVQGAFIYIASETDQFASWFGFAPTFTSGAASINGDDAVELFKNGAVIDVFGDINTDGNGEAWEYMDGWAYSKSNRTASATFNASEWTYSGPDALDGETDNANASSPFPVGQLPVELTAFAATADGSSAELTWATASETHNIGFEVQMDAGTGFTAAGFVAGAGTTLEAQQYRFRTAELASGSYRFRLKQIDLDGAFAFSPVVELTVASSGVALEVTSPFRSDARIRLEVEREQDVQVAVYNVLGRRVALLHDGPLAASAARTFVLRGDALASGLYFVRAQGETFTTTRQIVRLR